MGSDSDLAIMKEACDMLDQFSVTYDVTVCSAHRLPHETATYASTAESLGVDVIIAGAEVQPICPVLLPPIQFCR
jgi:phosphoribosylaminoimidazole carboxylase PurE protein